LGLNSDSKQQAEYEIKLIDFGCA
jgi:3-phosphoinositide dependent protein kinase-1